ncbi:MAG TPA: phage portal protein [Terriglobales bacterium]|nr:phage portal protein [Terriglobales bacterium]
MGFNLTGLRNAWAAIKNDGGTSTLAAPSADFVRGLMGFPTASGKVVTRETAIRVASFLAGVKMLSADIAKMPLVLRSRTEVKGRVRTQSAITNPLYTLLKDCPNALQTSYQMRWFLASQLIMAGNAFCQIIRNRKGDIISLWPVNAWNMVQQWDREVPGTPVLFWRYTDGAGNIRRFEQADIWHTTSVNLEGMGIEGTAITVLAKEALSVLMAAEETAGRQFANGLGMSGFLSAPPESSITEVEAQNTVDRLKKDFSGSQNAAKFSILPGGLKWEKMSFNAAESQLLESRKWNAEEVIRLLGGAPLLVKLGMGAQNSTYASSSAFLDEYYNTSLLPFCVSFEQTIMRDLIPQKDRATLYAKHDANIILRGSLRERAETYKIQLESGQICGNEVRIQEDMDTVDGLDYFQLPANSAVFNPDTQEIYIPGQDLPGKETDADDAAAKPAPAVSEKPSAATARLAAIANSLAERVLRKESKGGKLDPEFVSDVLNISVENATVYLCDRKSGAITADTAKSALIALITNADANRDSSGRFATGGSGGAHELLKTAAVHDQLTKLYAEASPSYHGTDKIEHSFTVDGAGQPRNIQSSHDSAKSSVTVHPGDKTIVHSHPNGTDPKPSDADIAIAKQFGIPNYELSHNQLWVANPDGTTAKVGDVSWSNGDLDIKWK